MTRLAAMTRLGCAALFLGCVQPGRVEIIAATAGEPVAAQVQRELARTDRDRNLLLVYVGAPWCEPCQYFHQAATRGELDRSFPGLRLLEFDHDRDLEALRAAGYKFKYIPLFARPGRDGRGTDVQIEGSVKGEEAVAEITPRLKALLGKPGR